MKNIDLHISYDCPNKCVFCSEGTQLDILKGHRPSFSVIKRLLEKKRKEGFDFVNFTGGEPTLRPDLLKIAEFAKKLGFRTYIGSNGSVLKDPVFCKKAVKYLDEISLSVHGYDNKSHDGIVGRKGAFKDADLALANLQKLKFRNIYANIVVTRKNFGDIRKIIGFLAKRSVRHILVSSVAPEGKAARIFKDLSPRLSEWRKEIPGIIALCEEKNIVVRFFGLPLCALDNIALSNDMSWDPRITIESAAKRGRIEQMATASFLPDRKRIKPKICKRCVYKDICCGVFEAYHDIWGDKELTPKFTCRNF